MDIFDIFDKIFSAISHLNFLTIFVTIFTLFMIGLLILLGFSTNQSRIEYYNYAMAQHDAPGSTFKLASVIAGLEDGKFKVTDSIDLQRGMVKYFEEWK